MILLTCGDDTQSNLSNLAVDIRWIPHLADVCSIVGEHHLSNYDGGITAHDITGPGDAFHEDALQRRVWFLLVVEHLHKRKLSRLVKH